MKTLLLAGAIALAATGAAFAQMPHGHMGGGGEHGDRGERGEHRFDHGDHHEWGHDRDHWRGYHHEDWGHFGHEYHPGWYQYGGQWWAPDYCTVTCSDH